MSNLIETKSLLAKLMATENIHIEQRKVSSASFDLNNRVLTVPILSNDIDADTYDLFMGHEVGHALYTDYNEWKNAFEVGENMNVLNIVEDFRIEKKIKYKYPGLKNVFVRAYNGLFNNNFFKTNGKNLDEYNFIDRINLHTKVGAGLNIQFNEEERSILKEMESIQSFTDAIVVQRKIVAYMKEQANQELNEDFEDVMSELFSEEEGEDGQGSSGFDFDDEGERGPSDKSEDGEEASESEGQSDESEKSSEGESDDETNSSQTEKWGQDAAKANNVQPENGAGGSDDGVEIRSETDEAYKENEHRLFSSSKVENVYVNAPTITDNVIVGFKELYDLYDYNIRTYGYQYRGYEKTFGYDHEGFVEIRNSINKTVSYLVKEFELRKNAEQMKKASTAKTGDLNMNKIYSYQFNDDIFKKLTVVGQGKSHGLVIFVDWSGSMVDHLYNTVKQLFNLVMFCKKVNIPYEVYGFSDHSGISQGTSIQKTNKNDLCLNSNLRLLNILSSKMNAAQFAKAASVLTWVSRQPRWVFNPFTLGGTPLNDTILTAMDVVTDFKKDNRLQVVNTVFLTDGESNNNIAHFNEKGQYQNLTNYSYHNGSYSPKNLIIRDPVTRHEVSVRTDEQEKMTATFIKLLKYRTNSNIIGFYILNQHEANRKIYTFYPKQYDQHAGLCASFRKNKHLVVTSQGYDEYYLLKSDKRDDDDDTFEVKSTTTKSIVNAFSKFAGNKMNSRTVLNRFIGLIS